MPTTIEELQQKLNANTYTPKTDEQIQAEAQNQYKGVYEQNRLNAQQNYDATAQALKNQLATLGTAYERQAKQAQENIALSISAADRRSLGRGMQRSSYNAATLANLQAMGDETLAGIAADRTAAEAAIAAQQTLAAQQLQQQLAQLDSSYASDVQAAIDALRNQDYERQVEADKYANALLMQMFELQEQQKANELALKLQEEQLKAAQRENAEAEASTGASGGSSGGTKAPVPTVSPAPSATPSLKPNTDAMNLLNQLSGLTENKTLTLPTVNVSPVVKGVVSGLANMLVGNKAKKTTTTTTKSSSPAKTATKKGKSTTDANGINSLKDRLKKVN